MGDTRQLTWECSSCHRRVPLRVQTCHCGTTREEARAAASALMAAAAEPTRAPDQAVGPGPSLSQAFAEAPKDVKAMAIGSLIALVAGLVWLAFAPTPQVTTPAVLGWVDPGPPRVVKPTPSPQPPFKLPWWK